MRFCFAESSDGLPEHFFGLAEIGINFISEILPGLHGCPQGGLAFASHWKCGQRTKISRITEVIS